MIATLDELAAALVRAQSVMFRKNSLTLAANQICDYFHFGGGFPANAPASAAGLNGEFMDNAKVGAFPFDNPLAGETINIGRIAAIDSVNAIVSVADRIWQNSINMATAGTTKQNIVWPGGAQRYSDGEGVELYATITTNLANTTAATWTVEFIDQSDTLRTATVGYNTTSTAGRMLAFDLPAGATGVKSVVSFQSNVAQASGVIELVLVRRIVDVPLLANTALSQSGLELGLPTVQPSACLFLMTFMGSSTSSGTICGKADIVQG